MKTMLFLFLLLLLCSSTVSAACPAGTASGSANANAYITSACPNVVYCSGSASATAATCTGVPSGATVYTNMTGFFVAGANSTGAPLTLNVNSLGAKNVYLNGAATSATNVVFSGGIYPFYYDGTEIQLTPAAPAPVSYWQSPGGTPANGTIAASATQSAIIAVQYVPPVTFGHIYINISTADATHLYSWGAYNTSGTAICTTTAADLTPTGVSSATNSACSQGTVFWPGGTILLIGGGTATAGNIAVAYGGAIIPYNNQTITGTTISGGQVPSSVTLPAAGAVVGGGQASFSLQP